MPHLKEHGKDHKENLVEVWSVRSATTPMAKSSHAEKLATMRSFITPQERPDPARKILDP